jgi:hypothetical protein
VTEQLEVLTAFTVVVGTTGQAFAVPDMVPDGLVLRTAADAMMIRKACVEISDDILMTHMAERIAEMTVPTPAPTAQEIVLKALRERGKLAPDE